CGMHGTYAANMAIQHADLLISIGARFDDRVTGRTKDFAPMAKIVHIDIDDSEINKNVPTDLPILGDAREALKILLEVDLKPVGAPNWIAQLNKWQTDYPLWYKEDGSLKPQQVIEELHRITGGDAVVTTDVGQHQMWVAQFFGFKQPRRLVTSGGLGTMGFGFPAALGAALSNPDAPVISVVGDGGFQMNIQELATASDENIPVTTIILNNASLGMVRQWQEILYEKRFSHSLLPKNPDFTRVSESFGVKGYRVTTLEEFSQALQEALSLGKPAVLDVHVTPHEHVYPMVCAGSAIDEMIGIEPPADESVS
ncbi:MAG: acetolactate synthase large subunit, partial [Clostridiales bacterium]|nr:acetolactate synthase large subunit [Clostridiales bacterium]